MSGRACARVSASIALLAGPACTFCGRLGARPLAGIAGRPTRLCDACVERALEAWDLAASSRRRIVIGANTPPPHERVTARARCSFCDRGSADGRRLVARRGCFACEVCVVAASRVLAS